MVARRTRGKACSCLYRL